MAHLAHKIKNQHNIRIMPKKPRSARRKKGGGGGGDMDDGGVDVGDVDVVSSACAQLGALVLH